MTQSSPDPRAAIVEHRDQVAAEPRPTQLGEAAEVAEGDDLYRVYRPEWSIVFVVEDGTTAGSKIEQYHNENLLGRVHPEDWRVVSDGEPPNAVLQLQVRLPNMRGEFKHMGAAVKFVREEGWDDYDIVQRNSPADHALRAYGTKRLPG